MKTIVTRALVATFLTAFLWTYATPALAQATSSTVVSRFLITPPAPDILAAIEACVGEAVTFNGTINVVAHETDNASGGMDVQMIFATQNVFAVGQTTGTIYRSPGQFETKLNISGPAPLEFSFLFDLGFIGPGQGPNFTLKQRFHITINAGGETTALLDTSSTVCK